MDEQRLQVQVCFAEPHRQTLIDLQVTPGTTIAQAVEQSFPEIDLALHTVGIYGKIKTVETVLREGDRVEIYRPLLADPKVSRRRRALHKAP